MKTLLSALLVLLASTLAAPSMAQSFEEQMRQAAGAYERKDMATAVRIWKVWAAKGDAEAQTLLGAMYWSGDGVPRNLHEAARLYRCRCQAGDMRALRTTSASCWGFGEGIPPRDDVEAYKWIKLSIDRYTAKNQDRLDQARKDLATLSARMTPAQITEAERRVRAWKPVPQMR